MSDTATENFEGLDVRVDGRVGRLTLDRPDRLNALGATTLRELTRAARWLDEQADLRVVVVSGNGRAFSAGADLRDPPLAGAAASSGLPWTERREIGRLGLVMAEAVERMRAVTVAKVHGHVVGGGVVLMGACDLRLAADGTRFSIPEVDLGIPLTWGAIPRLVRDVGPARTKDWVMTCRTFDADEALVAGLVNRVVAGDSLDRAADDLAETLADKPSVPIRQTKEQVNAASGALAAATTTYADGDLLLEAALDPEAQQAAAAYLERTFARNKSGG